MASTYDVDKASDPMGDMPDTPAIPGVGGFTLAALGRMCTEQATDSPAMAIVILDAILSKTDLACTMDPEDVGTIFGQVLWLARNSTGDVRKEAGAALSELAFVQRAPEDLRGNDVWAAHARVMYDRTHPAVGMEEKSELVGGL